MYDRLSSYIRVIDDVVPADFCDDIINLYKESPLWQTATVVGENENKIDASIRNVDTINLSQKDEIDNDYEQIRQKIDSDLFTCIQKALHSYSEMMPRLVIKEDTGYELWRYKAGQFYREHTDDFPGIPRIVSCSLMLNDDYEGGEFAFFNGTVRYVPKKGSALMFPSCFLYPHEIMPVTKGTRHSIVTWFR
jgi:predicted 2-oxoglutarate/Fe(II)-dependent dioxygenase YbiX